MSTKSGPGSRPGKISCPNYQRVPNQVRAELVEPESSSNEDLAPLDLLAYLALFEQHQSPFKQLLCRQSLKKNPWLPRLVGTQDASNRFPYKCGSCGMCFTGRRILGKHLSDRHDK